MERAELGKMGERIAAKYYVKQGYLLMAHNYHTRMGELDLVLRKGCDIVICEVKTRTNTEVITPAACVTFAKQQRIIRAAKRYLQLTQQSDCNIRFDVVEVSPQEDGKWSVHCIKQAFES